MQTRKPFETRFNFSRTQAQSARIAVRPDLALEFDTEAEALEAAAKPPIGARWVVVRQFSPVRRSVLVKQIRAQVSA